MFDIGWSELLVIGIVALVVIGPKELPGVVRMLAQNIAKLRRMASEFQGQLTDAMREMDLAEIKKDAEKLISDTTSAVSQPIEELSKTIESSAASKPASEVQPSPESEAAAGAEVAAAVSDTTDKQSADPAEKHAADTAAKKPEAGA